jgi:hypothetical protein
MAHDKAPLLVLSALLLCILWLLHHNLHCWLQRLLCSNSRRLRQ